MLGRPPSRTARERQNELHLWRALRVGGGGKNEKRLKHKKNDQRKQLQPQEERSFFFWGIHFVAEKPVTRGGLGQTSA